MDLTTDNADGQIYLKSWVVKDALSQLEVLISNKKAIEIGHAPDGAIIKGDLNIHKSIPLSKIDIEYNLNLGFSNLIISWVTATLSGLYPR